MDSPDSPEQSLFPQLAKLLLLFVLLLNLFCLGLLAYRFALPTDGWRVIEPDGFEANGFIYQENVLGVDSDLQVGDWVTAVNDTPIDNGAFYPPTSLHDEWQAGNLVIYTIQRGEQLLRIAVPLVPGRVWPWLAAAVSNLADILYYLGTAVFLAISYYTFWQRPRNPAAQALLVMAAFLLNILLTLDILTLGLADLYNPVANFATDVIILTTFSLLLPPAFIRLGFVFPRPKPILSKRPWLVYLPYLVGTAVLFLLLNKAFVWGWAWTGTAVLLSFLLLLHNGFTMRDTVSRGQMRWALGGASLGMGLFLLNYVGFFFAESSVSPMGQLLSGLSQLSFPLMGISLAVAVLRYSLFGIDRLVNRTLVYGGLTLSVVIIYVLVVGYLGYLFQTEANLTISLIATGVVAVLFDRLRGLLQRSVNRLMYGQRDEPYQLLTRLGQQLEQGQDAAATLPVFAQTVAQALKLPYTAVHVNLPTGSQSLASYGTPQNGVRHFSLVVGGETIGALIVGLRAPNEPLTLPDQHLLTDMARQLAATVQTVQLAADLERARLRIVTERGEARRQLGSDLHDRVGHQLAGLTRQVEKVIVEISPDAASARQSLGQVSQNITAVSTSIRELAHQLFPPELELLGLVGALRENAETRSGLLVLLDAPAQLSLPTAVETAVYTIALEAITNVEKHAAAQTCWVRIALNQGEAMMETAVLALDVRDNGKGFLENKNKGLGLLSMQARAIEVGGSCHFESNEDGGTAVIVRIPIKEDNYGNQPHSYSNNG